MLLLLRMKFVLLYSLILLDKPFTINARACYLPNGDPTADEGGFVTCNDTASQSHCCAAGWGCLSSSLVLTTCI